MLYKYTFPYPPSINHYYKRSRWGGVYLPDVVHKFRKNVQDAVEAIGQPPQLACPIAMEVQVIPPKTNRKRDLDNVLKPLQDAMQFAGVFVDDEVIERVTLIRRTPGGKGCVQVRITESIELI